MAKIKVYQDIWLNNRLDVNERSILMSIWKEMDNTNKVVFPSYSYLAKESYIPSRNVKSVVYRLQEEQLLRIKKEEPGRFIEIEVKKGKSLKAPKKIWFLSNKWWRSLLLTLFLKKGNKDYVWIDKSEIATYFSCSPQTAGLKLKEIEQQGLILRERYGYKYKVELIYIEV